MPAFPDAEIVVPIERPRSLSRAQYAALAAALAVLGLSTIWPTILSLWALWTTDALKSIGMFIPVVSLVLILRAWSALGWEAEGTWWGLALLLTTMLAERVQLQAIFIMVISPHWSTVLPPPSLMLLAYGSGVVLLFGGVRLYRAALFPILLLWFANPIPHVFSLLVDLPLQHVSAHVARAFAIDLGHPLTPDHLRLMFTPDFGMFIAPGCNGIRGSVTMGLIALVTGYVYRFRWYANAFVTAGAILLGYIFNLVRLCLLVLYYMLALHFTSLQDKAETADYLIGAMLFLLATLLLFSVIQHLRDAQDSDVLKSPGVPKQGVLHYRTWRTSYAPLLAMGATVLLGCIWLIRVKAAIHPPTVAAGDLVVVQFPQRLGKYALLRSWNEILIGSVVYVWAEYVPTGGGTPVTVGISPGLGWHDPLVCHYIRGEKPLWQGPLKVKTADGVPTSFNSAFYNDGVTQYIEASTICEGGVCGEYATERTHFGFIYSHPDPRSLFIEDPRRPIPVVIRTETTDTTVPVDVARQQLTNELQAFLTSVKIEDIVQPYSH